MPKYRVTVLRHQWAQLEIEDESGDAAFTAAHDLANTAPDLLEWETTLIEAVEMDDA